MLQRPCRSQMEVGRGGDPDWKVWRARGINPPRSFMLSARPYAQSTAWKPFSLYFEILLTPLTSFWWNLITLNRLLCDNSYETRLKKCLKNRYRNFNAIVIYLYCTYKSSTVLICAFVDSNLDTICAIFNPPLEIPCAVSNFPIWGETMHRPYAQWKAHVWER